MHVQLRPFLVDGLRVTLTTRRGEAHYWHYNQFDAHPRALDEVLNGRHKKSTLNSICGGRSKEQITTYWATAAYDLKLEEPRQANRNSDEEVGLTTVQWENSQPLTALCLLQFV